MDIAEYLKALGEPTRFQIFRLLLDRRHCTRSLSRRMGISEPAVSQHLRVLREAGLVYREQYGAHKHYLPSQDAVDFLAASFKEMKQASMILNRDGKECQCEFRKQFGNQALPIVQVVVPKALSATRVAVPYDRGEIFQKFGLTEAFKLYDTVGKKVTRSRIVDTEGYRRAALATFLKQFQVDAVICGNIGGGARGALAENGIRFYGGCAGSADQAVRELLDGCLAYDGHPPCSSWEKGDAGDGN